MKRDKERGKKKEKGSFQREGGTVTASQVAHVVKNLLANAGLSLRRYRFDPQVEKIPWRRKWQPIAVFLPGESHGQRSLAGYSPWGRKEANTT